MTDQRKRGPGRSEAARVAILTAAAHLLTTHGYEHLTMEGIAAEAKVGKQTIYRWWSSRSALVADCLTEGLLISDLCAPPDSDDLRKDVTTWLQGIIDFIGAPNNTDLLRSLVVASAENENVTARLNERLGLWTILGERISQSDGVWSVALRQPGHGDR